MDLPEAIVVGDLPAGGTGAEVVQDPVRVARFHLRAAQLVAHLLLGRTAPLHRTGRFGRFGRALPAAGVGGGARTGGRLGAGAVGC